VKRTEILKKNVFDTEPEICIDRAILVTESYKNTEEKPVIIRRAHAFEKVLDGMRIYINPGELIVGNLAGKPRSAPLFPEFGVSWIERELSGLPKRRLDNFKVTEEVNCKIGEIISYWRGKTHENRVNALIELLMPEEIKHGYDKKTHGLNEVIFNSSHISTGDGHIIANYGRIIQYGLNSVIQKAKQKITKLDISEPDTIGKSLFYQSVIIVCSAAINFAHRYANKIEHIAKKETNSNRVKELSKIAEICKRVPANPARNFREAIQSYWFLHLLIQIESNGHAISLGRFDQILYPYFEKDLQEGNITHDEALELVECFMIKCNEINKVREWEYTKYMNGYPMFQTLTIGGVKSDGSDATNEISYITLEATGNIKLPQPTTVVRVHDNTPRKFLFEASKTLINHGGGLPGFFNDGAGIPILQDLGAPLEEARDWAIVGCCEPVLPGKFCTVTGGVCHVNLLKVLELTLNDGINPNTGVALLPGTGTLNSFKSIKDIIEAYKKQLGFYLSFVPFIDNIISTVYKELTPTPFLSALIDNRIESAMDVSKGKDNKGYHNLLLEGHGSVNVGSSLAAIKKIVFDEKVLTGYEVQDVLRSNFSGIKGERVRQMLLNNVEKYGNDNEFVDNFVRDVINYYIEGITKYTPLRGGNYGPSTQGITANVPMGFIVGATPDGRKAGEALADNTSPAPGTDVKGPTAVLKSAARLNHRKISNGTILNLKFHPTALKGEERLHKFCDLIRTFFKLKGYQVQFNVISADVLRRAQKYPQEYKTLMVKVAGYSALYSTLDKKLQDQIIKRTTHTL